MEQDVQKKLAWSLTAKEDTNIIQYLPYLFQDLWELGTPVEDMIYLFRKHLPVSDNFRVLDLACGKGAVGIGLAKEFGLDIKMVDLMPEFVEFAREKAREYGLTELCEFEAEDIGRTVEREKGWDCVMLLAVGDILGNPRQTVKKLANTVRPGGYVIIEDSYIGDEKDIQKIRYPSSYYTRSEWSDAFRQAGLKLIEEFVVSDEYRMAVQNELSNGAIAKRAEELCELYPENAELFKEYVQNQRDESYDVENTVVSPIWVLRRE